jgi:hypothetical protein
VREIVRTFNVTHSMISRLKTCARSSDKREGFTPTLLYIIGIRHTLMLPGIVADMREFGQSGIRKHEREFRNGDAVDHAEITRDREGPDMAWHLQWLLLKAETRERRDHCSGF